jgi:hypothetical protein
MKNCLDLLQSLQCVPVGVGLTAGDRNRGGGARVSGRRALGDLPTACGGTFPAGVDAGDPQQQRTGTGSAAGRRAGVAGANARPRRTGKK